MTIFDWIFLIAIILIIAANCVFIWYKECVAEYVDNEMEEDQEEVNVLYIKEQMGEENIKSTIKKITQ